MPHGYPDWGRDDPAELLYGLPDMSELAARLWSPNRFSRHGHVIFMEGFEASLNKWRHAPVGAAAAALSNARARSGLLSHHLTAASAIADGRQNAIHEEPFPVLSSFGYELSVSGFDNVVYFEMRLRVYSAGAISEFGIRHTPATNALSYRDAAGGYTQIDVAGVPVVLPLRGNPTLFHTIKLVVDGVLSLYRYVIVNNVPYSLAGLVPQAPGTPLGDHLRIQNVVDGAAPNVAEVWVDDIILTQHEP